MVRPNANENGEEVAPSLSAAVLIPNFDGTATSITITEFIRVVDDAAGLSTWDDDQIARIARIKIQGPADIFLQSNPALLTAPWSALKRELAARFSQKESLVEVRNKLRDCIQGSSETATDFATRLRVIGNKLLSFASDTATAEERNVRQKVANEEVLAQFIKGLRESIRRFVSTHNPQTLEEALEKAAREESYLATNSSQQVPTFATAHTPDTRAHASRDRSQSPSPRQDIPPYQGRGRSSERGGYRKDFGNHQAHKSPARPAHSPAPKRDRPPFSNRDRSWSQDRPRNNRDNRPRPIECHYCGRPNHIERQCRTKEADSRRHKMSRFQSNERRPNNRNESLNSQQSRGNRRGETYRR